MSTFAEKILAELLPPKIEGPVVKAVRQGFMMGYAAAEIARHEPGLDPQRIAESVRQAHRERLYEP